MGNEQILLSKHCTVGHKTLQLMKHVVMNQQIDDI